MSIPKPKYGDRALIGLPVSLKQLRLHSCPGMPDAEGSVCGQAFSSFKCNFCHKKFSHPNTGVPTSCDDCASLRKLCKWCGCKVEILGHPILIGDVLERIDFLNTTQTKILLLIVAWKKCGADKSLQSIFDEAEWEEVKNCKRCDDWYLPEPEPHDCEKEIVKLVPKQPTIRELFQFLLQLGL